MSKDSSSQGIWGTSHSASSDTRGHSSFQLMEDSSRLVTKDSRVLHPQKSKEETVIFSQAWLPSRVGMWWKRTEVLHLHPGDSSKEVQEQLWDGTIPRTVCAPGFAGSGFISCSRSNPFLSLLDSTKPKFTAVSPVTRPERQTQPVRRSIPGKQWTPRHFAPTLGGSGGAPTQEVGVSYITPKGSD